MDAWPLARVNPPSILIYQFQLLQNTIRKCAAVNPILHSILPTYKSSSDIILVSKSCNSSLFATFEQSSLKSQDSVSASSHSSPAIACTIHQVNTTALIQFYLLNFQGRQLFSIPHQASSTGCMKTQSPARQSTSRMSNKV